MADQKAENLLNLALDATAEELEKSPALSVGFNREEKRWELIVKYNGDLNVVLEALPEIEAATLSGGYAILTVPQSLIESLTGFSQIEYIEKPKRLYFSVYRGRSNSCINQVQEDGSGLTGRGVITAIIDSGIDYYHRDFRDAAGKAASWNYGIRIKIPYMTVNRSMKRLQREAVRRLTRLCRRGM